MRRTCWQGRIHPSVERRADIVRGARLGTVTDGPVEPLYEPCAPETGVLLDVRTTPAICVGEPVVDIGRRRRARVDGATVILASTPMSRVPECADSSDGRAPRRRDLSARRRRSARRAAMVRPCRGLAALLAVLLGCTPIVPLDRLPTHAAMHPSDPEPAEHAPDDEWIANGRTAGGLRHSPLAQLTPRTVGQLAIAWRFSTGEATDTALATRRRTSFEATPLAVDGTLYFSTPLGRVFALDPVTGRERWRFDPRIDRTVHYGDFTNRGVSTWLDVRAAVDAPCRRRIVVGTIDARLIALDAATGARCVEFGEGGIVTLRRGLRTAPADAGEYELTSPPAVIGDLLVVGSAIADNNRRDMASGEVRGYDARTGALRWTWHPVPQDTVDPAYGTWGGPDAHGTGAANAWSVIAADPARDLVVVPTGSASPDYYGGRRLGDNRYANSIVALRASTGRVVWHFQTVHHDLWDYDNASPPVLATVRRGGRDVPAVLVTTKTGMLFLLHRETGEPLVPVEERAVPASTVPGEVASATQPFSSLPPLVPHRLPLDDVWGPTPADRDACRAAVGRLRNEGIFTPPSLEGTLALPSNVGGAHWGGLSYDPVRELVVVPVNRVAAEVQLLWADSVDQAAARSGDRVSRVEYEVTRMRGTPFVMRRRVLLGPSMLPCTPPPFGTLVAVSLRTGRIAWEVPLGTMGRVPGLTAGLPDSVADLAMGSINLGGPITTAGGLVFVAATLDRHLRAFDVESGREVWRGALPAGGKATPMTYRGADGRQYVVIAAGGDGGDVFGRADQLIAFALPAP